MAFEPFTPAVPSNSRPQGGESSCFGGAASLQSLLFRPQGLNTILLVLVAYHTCKDISSSLREAASVLAGFERTRQPALGRSLAHVTQEKPPKLGVARNPCVWRPSPACHAGSAAPCCWSERGPLSPSSLLGGKDRVSSPIFRAWLQSWRENVRFMGRLFALQEREHFKIAADLPACHPASHNLLASKEGQAARARSVEIVQRVNHLEPAVRLKD